MTVRLLDIEQKDLIVNQEYTEDMLFNPIQDEYDNWIISEEEVDQCTNPTFEWVKELPIIEFVPKVEESPFS